MPKVLGVLLACVACAAPASARPGHHHPAQRGHHRHRTAEDEEDSALRAAEPGSTSRRSLEEEREEDAEADRAPFPSAGAMTASSMDALQSVKKIWTPGPVVCALILCASIFVNSVAPVLLKLQD
mmetsp:Transcript_101484/g.316441  ORF Transcript_101484/g.316441 Transcript_101484/m.316441 type:complete len:125 (+) Transcript_101484:88-462(+)